jgi:hypothetical protein
VTTAVSAPGHERATAAEQTGVALRVTREEARTLHRSIPALVGRVRQELASQGSHPRRVIVLDLSAVPPTPIASPLLFLVHLLRRLAAADAMIDVTGVTPALVAALTAYDLPTGVTLIDTRGRRW